jgi:hypothetical protein
MEPWTIVSCVISFVIVFFTALVIGLTRHNVLQDPTTCCLPTLEIDSNESACSEILDAQLKAYYDPVLGLRTRYIVAIIFFLVSFGIHLYKPVYELISTTKSFHALLALISYTTMLLFTDTALRSFTTIPSDTTIECAMISDVIIEAIVVLAWFSLLLSALLFYMYMVASTSWKNKTVIKYMGEANDEETIAHHPNPTTVHLVSPNFGL